jgi:hypothetical protein
VPSASLPAAGVVTAAPGRRFLKARGGLVEPGRLLGVLPRHGLDDAGGRAREGEVGLVHVPLRPPRPEPVVAPVVERPLDLRAQGEAREGLPAPRAPASGRTSGRRRPPRSARAARVAPPGPSASPSSQACTSRAAPRALAWPSTASQSDRSCSRRWSRSRKTSVNGEHLVGVGEDDEAHAPRRHQDQLEHEAAHRARVLHEAHAPSRPRGASPGRGRKASSDMPPSALCGSARAAGSWASSTPRAGRSSTSRGRGRGGWRPPQGAGAPRWSSLRPVPGGARRGSPRRVLDAPGRHPSGPRGALGPSRLGADGRVPQGAGHRRAAPDALTVNADVTVDAQEGRSPLAGPVRPFSRTRVPVMSTGTPIQTIARDLAGFWRLGAAVRSEHPSDQVHSGVRRGRSGRLRRPFERVAAGSCEPRGPPPARHLRRAGRGWERPAEPVVGVAINELAAGVGFVDRPLIDARFQGCGHDRAAWWGWSVGWRPIRRWN